ncbi:hypothetical protein [Azotobacter chroococcum]|uniref:hypothetical protein n=1 Tax=Azotobacter chroococcum TaxID=353 RepID=UPI0010ADD079|nr:hypothetical protein [Azotobacter chroococcum]TKD47326.1 hypothetical protein FCG41_00095 [Azotobacter chroococcum]
MTDLQQQLSDLHQQRAALVAEQEELAVRVPQLQAEWRAMPTDFSPLTGAKIGTPESREAMEQASKAESRLRSLPGAIQRIDQQIAHLERLAATDEDIARHETEAKTALERAALLERQHAQLQGRLTALRAEAKQAQEAARQGEQEAAQAIARAAASSDAKAEKTAQAKLSQAIEAARLVGEKDRTSQIVIKALEQETATLAEQLSEARQQAADAHKAALQAELHGLRGQWDAAADDLAALGARLVALDRQLGGWNAGLSKLSVPRYAPLAGSVGLDELVRHAREDEAA